MSEKLQPVDDITMELATVLDEYSAVDSYRMKKERTAVRPCKKVLSYKDILQTDFPSTSYSDLKSPAYIGIKLPDSIDMDYIDMISGKTFYTSKAGETKIPIQIESYERLCYYTSFIKGQKQEMTEKYKLEGMMKELGKESETSVTETTEEEAKEGQEEYLIKESTKGETKGSLQSIDLEVADDAEPPGCSPCCSLKPTPNDNEAEMEELLLNCEKDLSKNLLLGKSSKEQKGNPGEKKKSIFKRIFSKNKIKK